MSGHDVEIGDGRTLALPRKYHDVLDRVAELKLARDQVLPAMFRTAMMMDGGERAVQAMLGEHKDEKFRDMPIANYMRDAADAFATRLGAVPDLRVDPPTTGRKSDENEGKQKAAEKRARIVASYDDDHNDGIANKMPMLARWVPGAAYAVFTIDPVMVGGHPYPRATLHSPLDTMLGQWSSVSRPEDVGLISKVPVREIQHLYPHHAKRFDVRETAMSGGHRGTLLSGHHRDGLGVTVVRYYDRHGTWVMAPDQSLLLDYIPNPLESGPAFVALTKFNYNRLRGEYDDMIGPMISMARLQILSEVSVRKDVAQPTNLFTGPGGALSGPYRQGFNATNIFDANSRVEIPNGTSQHQAWQQLDRLERAVRIEGTSPVQDSGESPMSFVTGRGMDALGDRVQRSVSETQRIFKAGLQQLDSKRLEYDEKAWPEISKPMQGVREGADFYETYIPKTHIKGQYRTRREYGAMAAVDEGARLNGMALMQQLGWTSAAWSRTQLSETGIPASQMEQQIRNEQAEQAFQQMLLTHANAAESPEHMRALQLVVEMLPSGKMKDLAEKWLTARGEELEEQEAAMMQEPQAQPSEQEVMAMLAGGGGAPQGGNPTTLARVTSGGGSEGGTQVIAGAGR